jgi:antitoxin component YwqK of YwqJK toxin-antitoxin module
MVIVGLSITCCGRPESPPVPTPSGAPAVTLPPAESQTHVVQFDHYSNAELVDLAQAGDPSAAAVLIKRAAWDDLGKIDPRPLAVSDWATNIRDVSPFTSRQIHGEVLVNWIVRHTDQAKDKESISKWKRAALISMMSAPVRHPILLSEIAWLAREELSHPCYAQLTFAAMRLLPENVDGLPKEEIQGRLSAWLSLLESESWWVSIFDESWKNVHQLLRKVGPQELLLKSLLCVLNMPYDQKRGNPVFEKWETRPDADALFAEAIEVAAKINRQDLLSYVLLRMAAASEERCASQSDWTNAARLYGDALAAAKSCGVIPDETLVELNFGLAWCLHQGPRFDVTRKGEVISAYEAAIAASQAVVAKNPRAYTYVVDPKNVIAVNLLRLQGNWTVTRQMLYPPDLKVEGLPFADHCRNVRTVEACRFGRHSLNLGHGPEVGWYEDGNQRAWEGAWDYGSPVGTWKWWHKNGRVAMEGSFKNGRPWGPWRTWKSDGTSEVDFNVSEEFYTGTFQYPGDGTKPGVLVKWKNGYAQYGNAGSDFRTGERVDYWQDGRERGRGQVVDWLRDGPWKEEFAAGKSKKSMIFRSGLECGPIEEWSADGSRVAGEMNAGMKHGLWKYWNKNGQLKSTLSWEHDTINGECKKWNEQGRLVERSLYSNGIPFDITIYDENGGVLSHETTVVDKPAATLPPVQ